MSVRKSAGPVVAAARSVIESLENRRLLTGVTDTDFSFLDYNQQFSVTFDGAVANQIAPPAFQVQNLTTGGTPVKTYRSGITAGDTVAVFKKDVTDPADPSPILADGWYETSVQSDLLTNDLYADKFSFLNCDFNGDRAVNFNDFLIIQTNLGSTGGMKFSDGDANYDGKVDFDDYMTMSVSFGRYLPALPTQPGDVVVANTTGNTLDVAWTPSTAPVDGYKIYRSTDGVTFDLATSVSATTQVWQDTGLTAGEKYWYRVRSYTAQGGVSTSIKKAWGIASSPTPAVSTLAAAGIGPGRIAVKWTPVVSDQIVSYRIYRSENPAFVPSAATLVTATNPNNNRIVDSGVSVGHRYYYKVVAVAYGGIASSPSLNASALAQNEGKGISNQSNNNGTPFDPTVHDNDGDGIVDTLDYDNDNDGKIDELDDDDDNDGIGDNAEPDDQDADLDGNPDSTEADNDNDGTNDGDDEDDDEDGIANQDDASTGVLNLVGAGAGFFEVFKNGGLPSYSSNNGYTPKGVEYEASLYEDPAVYGSADVPKLDDITNNTQTITLYNLPKHALVTFYASVWANGIKTASTPNATGEVELKIGGTQIEQGIGTSYIRYEGTFESDGGTLPMEFKGSGFDTSQGQYWGFYNILVRVEMPSATISVQDPYSHVEGDTLMYRVDRIYSTNATGSMSVKLDWGKGTAGSGDASVPPTLDFADGEQTKYIPVTLSDDGDAEYTESLVAQIAPGEKYYITKSSPPTRKNDILDNDAIIELSPDELIVNNNDSNNNNVIDLNETGASQDPDILAVDVALPEEGAGRVSYSFPGNIRLWETSDKSSEILSGHEISVDRSQVFVEAVGGSSTMASTVITQRLIDPNIPLQATPAQRELLPVPTTQQSSSKGFGTGGVEIQYEAGYEDYRAGSKNYIIGEQVRLKAVNTWPAERGVATFSFDVEGEATRGRKLVFNAANEFVSSTVPPLQGKIEGTDAVFHWTKGDFAGVDRKVTLTAKFPNKPDSTNSTAYKIFAPKDDVKYEASVTVPAIGRGGTVLQAAGLFDRITMPTIPAPFVGEIWFMQILHDVDDRFQLPNQTWKQMKVLPSSLDNSLHYGTDDPVTSSTTDGPLITLTDPATGIKFKEVHRHFSATMYIMWKSSQENAMPVPLASIDWEFTGKARQKIDGSFEVYGSSTGTPIGQPLLSVVNHTFPEHDHVAINRFTPIANLPFVGGGL